MAPHGYRPGRGDPVVDEQRARVLAAARRVVTEQTSVSGVSIDAIAARAGVARTIVHQQFGTTAGVLEALFDHLTETGCLGELPRALELPEPLDSLDAIVAVYARFWDADRELFRRIKSVAAFDAALRAALVTREAHRREGVRNLARRLGERGVRLPAEPLELLFALTGFELLDGLAGPERAVAEVVPVVQALARSALDAVRP